jgi:hypothetical protein
MRDQPNVLATNPRGGVTVGSFLDDVLKQMKAKPPKAKPPKPAKAGVGSIRYSLDGWGEKVGKLGEKKPRDDSWLRAYIFVMAAWPGDSRIKLYDKPETTVELSIPAGTKGVVKFFGHLEYAIESKQEKNLIAATAWEPKWVKGIISFSAYWGYDCSPEGRLEFPDEKPQTPFDNPDGHIALAGLDAHHRPGSMPIGRHASINPIVQLGGTTRTASSTSQTESGTFAPLGVGVNFETTRNPATTAMTAMSGKTLGPFVVDLRVTGAKPPDVVLAPEVLKCTVYFPFADPKKGTNAGTYRFTEVIEPDGAKLHQGDKIYNWLTYKLGVAHPELVALLKREDRPLQVYVQGRASVPGDPDDNDRLGERRAEAVKAKLESFLGKGAVKVVPSTVGERNPSEPDRPVSDLKRGSKDQVARIWIDAGEAKSKLLELRSQEK